MIVRSISLENWRCYLDPVTVGPLDDRLNVIYGPNATGKSSLFEALRRAFLDGHRVSGEVIGLIAPWGRPGLTPRVTVEFVHKGTEYRITKQFLRNQSSVLERKEKGRFERWREGSSADEWVRGLLGGMPPARGVARPEHWGLAQILWAPQGNLALPGLSGDLGERIRSSLGAQLVAGGSSDLEDRIERLYLQVYTSSGKKLKTGKDAAPLVRAQKELEELRSRRDAAREKLRRFESACARVTDLRDRQAQAEREAAGVQQALEAARSKAGEYESLLGEMAQREKDAEAAEVRYGELKRRVGEIEAARKEQAEAREELEKLNMEIPVVEQEIASWQGELARAKARLEDVRKEREVAEKARNLAEEARAFVENKKKLDDWRRNLSDIQAAHQALEKQKGQLEALRAPDARTLRLIREALNARERALRDLESSLITLEIVPERETAVEVIEGEVPGSKTVSAGMPLQVQGAPRVVARLPGIARLRAWGPAQSVEQNRKALDDAERTLRKLTEPFGTADIEELERRHEKANELEKQVSNWKTRIDTLSGGQPVEREISRLEAFQEEILGRHPEWQRVLPDAGELDRAARDIHGSLSQKEKEAQAAYEKALNDLKAAEARRTHILAEINAKKDQLSRSRSRLDSLISDGRTDEERKRELADLALKWDAARRNVATLKDQLSAFASDSLSSVEKLEKQLAALRETAGKARDEANIEEGQLRALAAEGPYSELAQLEEEFTAVDRQVREEGLRAAAIKLLYETVEECRKEALSAMTGPVERAAARMLRRIAGDRLGSVILGKGFTPERVQPEEGVDAPLDSVSGGEGEQIHLATRLALAEVLAGEDRQLVVWDDVLAATDMERLARVLTLIEEAADRLQIVILTCHPERYRGLADAHFIDLEALVRSAL